VTADTVDRAVLRESRELFLSSGHVPDTAVREEIAASWRRSRMSGVNPGALNVPYEPDLVNPEGRLRRVAAPVMERFAARLADTPTGLFLADREVRGVGRWLGMPALAGPFDAIGAAEGFRFDEETAGTTALGTPAELGRSVKITGSEHWVEQLSALTCAGAPIRNPITKQIEGIVDLTCVAEHNADLLLALVQEIAFQVEERFYLDTSIQERLMLRHFSAPARNSSRPVMALNRDMILTNPAASRLTRGIDQELLWDLADRVMHANRESTETISHGATATVAHCAPIRDGADVVGVTIELKREDPERAAGRPAARAAEASLPPLVGRSPAWRSICRRVRAARTQPALVVTGETGAGKTAVALAWCTLRGAPEPRVLDAAIEAVQGTGRLVAGLEAGLLDGADGAVVLRHADLLSVPAAAALGVMLDRRGSAAPPLAVTVTTGAAPLRTEIASFLDRLGAPTVEIGPLRRRREDVIDLVEDFAGDGCASAAMQVLMRQPWERNVRELRHVIEEARALRPTGPLGLADLSPAVRGGARRRMLSTLEQVEVDAIVAALDDAGGNKLDAAAALGISRSTLYRKLHAYGLDLDRATF
jgi:transcriptional regulator of acetoin/glycerol metabolism